MSEKQPEALRLADHINAMSELGADPEILDQAADELRHQHALLEEMAGELSALLHLIRRNAPELSGKTMGCADAVLAKWEASK